VSGFVFHFFSLEEVCKDVIVKTGLKQGEGEMRHLQKTVLWIQKFGLVELFLTILTIYMFGCYFFRIPFTYAFAWLDISRAFD
jgi:uncharacterized transporter YbjL